jgi:hypothetical protein
MMNLEGIALSLYLAYALFNCYDSVFQVVGNALESATESQKKISKQVDEKFKEAINALSDYEKRYHSNETVVERMVTAEAKDKSSLTILNKLKGKLRVRGSTNDRCFVAY